MDKVSNKTESLGKVRATLKESIFHLHEELENSDSSNRMFEDDYSKEELIDFLQRMTLIYRCLEGELTNRDPALAIDYNPRLPILLRSLECLKSEPWKIKSETPNLNLNLNSIAAKWGAIYIIEGSTMGGQMIQKKLSSKFPKEAIQFFTPNGNKEETAKKWKNFCSRLELAINNDKELEEAKLAAVDTFKLFDLELTK